MSHQVDALIFAVGGDEFLRLQDCHGSKLICRQLV
jgi:hypothetical protein